MKPSKLMLCLSAGLLPMAAAADDEIEKDDSYLGTIVISNPTAPGLGEDEINVTSEGIALSNPADLSELFVAEPTIQVGSAIPMSQKVYVNGIEENNLAITIDGARQNNKIFHHNTTTLIDPALLKAVRVSPGVAPADAGPGALAGALAYETKDVGDLLATGETFGGRYKVEYDSNGDIFSNNLTVYGRQGGFEYLGFAKLATGNERVDGNGTQIIGSATNLISGLGKLAYQTETGSRFELSVEQVTDDEARPYRANIGQIIGGRPVPPTRPYELSRTNVVFTYTEANPSAAWDPRFLLAYSGTKLFNDESGLSTMQTIMGETTSFNGSFSNRFRLNWGEVNAGVDFFSDRADIDYVYLPDTTFNEYSQEKLQNVGLFAQVTMEPSASSQLTFGLRADHQKFEGTDGSTQSASGVSANIAGEVSVTDRFKISAGYSHVWGGIELAENYIMNPAWTYPASGIEPVTADNLFLAASYDAGNWIIDGKLFATRIDNARAASYSGGPGLTADVESQGFELGIGTSWDGGFFRAGYANIDTKTNGRVSDSYTGNYLTMPLGEFVTVQAAHRFDNGVLIGGDAQVAFDYDDTYDFATGGRGPTIPGYAVANVFAEYTPPSLRNLRLRAEINNLFDQQYAARATYGQEFVGEVLPLYEPGRSVRLSAEILF